MSSLEIVNLGGLVTGRLGEPRRECARLRCEDGRVVGFDGRRDADQVSSTPRARSRVPGLIDSHAHVVFGDWTPRQSALGWIESSMHGGVTMMMSASEVHLPGRPRDREGVKALAMAAQRAFASYRPGGVKVLAGSLIIEPGLEPEDFAWLAAQGVVAGQGRLRRLRAPGGRGAARARRPGGGLRRHEPHRRRLDPRQLPGHCRGRRLPSAATSSAMPTAARPRCPTTNCRCLFEAPGAIQLVQAGNLRSSLRLLELAARARRPRAHGDRDGHADRHRGDAPGDDQDGRRAGRAGGAWRARRHRAGNRQQRRGARRQEGVLEAGRPGRPVPHAGAARRGLRGPAGRRSSTATFRGSPRSSSTGSCARCARATRRQRCGPRGSRRAPGDEPADPPAPVRRAAASGRASPRPRERGARGRGRRAGGRRGSAARTLPRGLPGSASAGSSFDARPELAGAAAQARVAVAWSRIEVGDDGGASSSPICTIARGSSSCATREATPPPATCTRRSTARRSRRASGSRRS